MMKLSVVIPVYKKTDMFVKNFLQDILFLPKNTEIVIVDDASHENLDEKLQPYKRKADINLIENKKNLGFAAAMNKGIQMAKGNFILLLNSDVRLTSQFPLSLENVFTADPALAAITFAEKETDGTLLGKSKVFFKRGLVGHARADDTSQGLSAWANGGSCLFRADRLTALSAFDELYAPFYWEDIDLSFRAYSRGWHILFYPQYVVEHARTSTIEHFFKPAYVQQVAYRNQFFFTWSNITDFSLCLQHLLWLPFNLFLMSIKGETGFITGFFSAMPHLLSIFKRRSVKLQYQKISDRKIFALFS